ncbi:hypothetical protein F2Q68_00036048 [Brassica cretica]|uniref:RNase H type-1 domain-containing protein n=1 Tax=Brassica cretica TaxID=69181 RepID=A0A8S9H3C2_BRACR|nr:hypothetical protein F2Q68_00036048 [Brassica cretica]
MAAETIDIGGEDQPVGGDQTSQGTEVVMWKCQVDASWIEDQGDTGLGFVLLDDERITLFGFKALAPELDEIKALSSDFSSFSISAIPRSQNARADRLAKGGRLRKLNPSVSAFAPIWLAPEASLMAAE